MHCFKRIERRSRERKKPGGAMWRGKGERICWGVGVRDLSGEVV